ncbi:MAG: ATP-binding protein [Minisyncoccia bacterium]
MLKECLRSALGAFFSTENTKRVLVVNPEEITALKQEENVKNGQLDGKNWSMYAPFSEMSVAEITRILSETVLEICRDSGLTEKAKAFLVYEEAHSLIPEWNSVANEGDKSAANGTARVILQGRKYGLGSMVVTQRTANISKSILNQCNTIFALRVFDDTGKQFLENYIGSDFSNILPTLDDRHAIIIGKALKLKQPVIAKLNERELLFLDKEDSTDEGPGSISLANEATTVDNM